MLQKLKDLRNFTGFI